MSKQWKKKYIVLKTTYFLPLFAVQEYMVCMYSNMAC